LAQAAPVSHEQGIIGRKCPRKILVFQAGKLNEPDSAKEQFLL